MIIKKYKTQTISTVGDTLGIYTDLLNSKYAPHSRIIINDKDEKLLVIYFLSHKNTQIDNKLTFSTHQGKFCIEINTLEPEVTGEDIIVQLIIECKNYKQISSKIIKKEIVFIGIMNSNKIGSDIRHGGIPTDPIPTYPPFLP
jgi:hypothetical protein